MTDLQELAITAFFQKEYDTSAILYYELYQTEHREEYMIYAIKCYELAGNAAGQYKCLYENYTTAKKKASLSNICESAKALALHLQQQKEYENAIIYYRIASQCYTVFEKPAHILTTQRSIVNILITDLGDYESAVMTFEYMIKICSQCDLLKYTLDELFFRQTICNLVYGNIDGLTTNTKHRILNTHTLDPKKKLLYGLLSAVIIHDINMWDTCILEYTQMLKLEEQTVAILDIVRQRRLI